ncbi:hypothetical protein V9T40_011782 [Parthenolecanium corni]|uniref:Translin n=1 Tax=Parthenolecanium corni TaxID=536013 RepID=A0AAN9TLX8_9HEMI
METIIKTFSNFQESIDSEQNTKETIKSTTKEIEEFARKMITVLQIIHQEGARDEIPTTCNRCKAILNDVKKSYAELGQLVESGLYYKFYDHWKLVTQKLCFVIALIHYLETGSLKTRAEIASTLGLKTEEKDGFHLSIEDYLFGLLMLVSELARFAVNAVTNGDYTRPIQISQFVAEINAGFRLLSLKNDGLRKRYDALKYDVKKIEEVVYDLSIRGLKSNEDAPIQESAARIVP